MRTVSIFKNGHNQAIRLPKEFEFEGVNQLEILRQGDTVLLRPIKPSWSSFKEEPLAAANFLTERPDVIEEGRFIL
jgi:antitoxin VapB